MIRFTISSIFFYSTHHTDASKSLFLCVGSFDKHGVRFFSILFIHKQIIKIHRFGCYQRIPYKQNHFLVPFFYNATSDELTFICHNPALCHNPANTIIWQLHCHNITEYNMQCNIYVTCNVHINYYFPFPQSILQLFNRNIIYY